MPRYIADYHENLTRVSQSVLLEIMTILKSYRQALVLIGGWTPYFLLRDHQPSSLEFRHVGSIDIDLVIDPAVIDERKYQTIVGLLEERGYRPSDKELYQFWRTITSGDGKDYTVGVDFLAPLPEKGQGVSRRHRQIQRDLKARNLWGAEVAIQLNHEIQLEGILPGNGETSLSFEMASLPALFALKGIAFGERYREKDAYDIYALCEYYEAGPHSVAEEISPHRGNPVVKKGLEYIRERFRSPEAEGPDWVANFLALLDQGERLKLRQRAFMVVDETLRRINTGE